MTVRRTLKKPARRGRPLKTDDSRRERLLDAALREFSEQGVATAPLNAIARRARVTPALLHYYFGNRESLIDAVFAERIVPLIGTVWQRLAVGEARPRELVASFVRNTAAVVAEYPWLPQLWVREVLSPDGQLRERMIGGIVGRLAPQLMQRFAEAQRAGQLNRALDPRLTLVSLLGLTMFPFAAEPIWRRLADAGDITPDTLVQHTLALLERGLEFSDDA